MQHTRVLSIKGIPAIEVEENEVGTPVTAAFHMKVPPRHNGVFQVNIHGDTEGTYIISPHPQLEERNPNIFQHEIAIVSDDEVDPFPLVAVTSLDHAKTLHIGKGEIIRFAKPETNSVTYIATTNEINIKEYVDTSPRNWIPERKRKLLGGDDDSEKSVNCSDVDSVDIIRDTVSLSDECKKWINHYNKKNRCVGLWESLHSITEINCKSEKQINREDTSWQDINEVIDSDFLISPGDIYPDRKVELQDTEISDETKHTSLTTFVKVTKRRSAKTTRT